MWWSARLSWAVLLLVLCVPGCGYQLATREPLVLPKNSTKLFLSKVINPSTETWMEPMLRTALRDEFTRRGKVAWVERAEAQATVKLEVTSYSSSSSVLGRNEATLKSAASISLVVNFYDASTNTLIWSSGAVSASESFRGTETKRDATQKAIELAMRMVADRLGHNF